MCTSRRMPAVATAADCRVHFRMRLGASGRRRKRARSPTRRRRDGAALKRRRRRRQQYTLAFLQAHYTRRRRRRTFARTHTRTPRAHTNTRKLGQRSTGRQFGGPRSPLRKYAACVRESDKRARVSRPFNPAGTVFGTFPPPLRHFYTRRRRRQTIRIVDRGGFNNISIYNMVRS